MGTDKVKAIKGLTHKQSRFVFEYMKTGNATESYKRAGYSATTDNIAGVEGHKLLKHPKICKALQEQVKEFKDKAIMDAEDVLSELTKIARGEVKEQVLIGVGGGTQAITEKETTTADRLKALELMGRRYALFTDNINADVESQVVFVDDISDEDG